MEHCFFISCCYEKSYREYFFFYHGEIKIDLEKNNRKEIFEKIHKNILKNIYTNFYNYEKKSIKNNIVKFHLNDIFNNRNISTKFYYYFIRFKIFDNYKICKSEIKNNKLFSNKNLVFSDKIVKNSSIKENAIVKHKGIYFFTLLNKSVYNKIKITNLSNNVVEKFYIKTFSIEIVNNFIVLNTKQNEIF